MVEVMFAVRKDGFKDHVAVMDDLDLVEEEEQFTHLLQLEDAKAGDEILNVFKEDPNFQENEEKYKALKKEILEEGSSDEESGESGSESDSDDSEDEEEEEKEQQKIIDQTETNLVALRRTIYLTVQSSLDHNECAHKMLKMELKPGQEVELCNMILDCCAQLRTYEKFFGLLAQRFCQIDKKYIDPFQQIFMEQYETIHRLETNKLRNVAKFFSHLLHTDAISWGVMSTIKLTEEDTTSASRIFLKILFQELSEYMGLLKLNERLKDQTLSSYFGGILPRDNPKNTRFAINFFTTIGLGGLTDDLRDHLKVVAKQIMQQKAEEEQAQREAMVTESEDDSSSDSSDSDSSSSSSSDSDSEPRRKKKKGKPEKKKSKVSEKSKKSDKERSKSKSSKRSESKSKKPDSKSKSSKRDKKNKEMNGSGGSKGKSGGRSIAERLLDMAQYAQAQQDSVLDKSPEPGSKRGRDGRDRSGKRDVEKEIGRGGERNGRDEDRVKGQRSRGKDRFEENRSPDLSRTREKGRDKEVRGRRSPDESDDTQHRNRSASERRGHANRGEGRAKASDYFREQSEERNMDRMNYSREKKNRKRDSFEDNRSLSRTNNKENQRKRKKVDSSSEESDSSSSEEDVRHQSKRSQQTSLLTKRSSDVQNKRNSESNYRRDSDVGNKKGAKDKQQSSHKKKRMDSSSDSDSSSDESERRISLAKKSVKSLSKKARKSVSSSNDSSDSEQSSPGGRGKVHVKQDRRETKTKSKDYRDSRDHRDIGRDSRDIGRGNGDRRAHSRGERDRRR